MARASGQLRAHTRPAARWGVLAVAGLLAALALIPVEWVTDPVPTRGIDAVCPPPLPDAFEDDDGAAHEPGLNCLARLGLLEPGGQAAAPEPVTRAEVAVLLEAVLDRSGTIWPVTPPDAFVDDTGSVETALDRLAAVGLLRVDPSHRFEPDAGMSRGELAVLLVRALDLLAVPAPPATDDLFRDDEGTVEDAAQILGGLGVVGGEGRGELQPYRDVTHGYVATTAARLIDYLVEVGVWSG